MGFDYLQITMHPAKLQDSGETVQSWSQIVIWKVISRFVNGQGSNLCTLKLQDLGRPRVALMGDAPMIYVQCLVARNGGGGRLSLLEYGEVYYPFDPKANY